MSKLTIRDGLEIPDGALYRLRADEAMLIRDEHGALDRPDPNNLPPSLRGEGATFTPPSETDFFRLESENGCSLEIDDGHPGGHIVVAVDDTPCFDLDHEPGKADISLDLDACRILRDWLSAHLLEQGAETVPAWLDPADAADGRWYFGRWDSQGWGENQTFRPVLRHAEEWFGRDGETYRAPTALYGPIEPQAGWFDPSEDA